MVQEAYNLDLSIMPGYFWYAFGVLLTTLKGSPIESKLPEDLDIAFKILEKAKQVGLSDAEVRQQYRLFLQKYTANVGLNQEVLKAREELRKELGEALED